MNTRTWQVNTRTWRVKQWAENFGRETSRCRVTVHLRRLRPSKLATIDEETKSGTADACCPFYGPAINM